MPSLHPQVAWTEWTTDGEDSEVTGGTDLEVVVEVVEVDSEEIEEETGAGAETGEWTERERGEDFEDLN